ncbi:MAG TPA: hypothetical protein HA260_01340, partial [Thermoplasmata archaeon]|nr:hypothetical protein [Thermoplasmata archaeon]
MAKKIWGKVLVCGIIILFIGTSSIPSTETMTKQSEGSKHLLNERAPTISQPLSVLTTRLALQNQQRDIAFCYACNVVANPPYWFSSDDEYLAPCILPNFPSGSDIDSEGNLYAVDYGGGIYQIFYDGYQVFVAASIAFNSLTYDPESGLWYACDMTYLYTVNMTTGTSTVVGPLNVPNTIIGIACNLAGEMYGYDVLWTGDSTLYSIDKDTGACIAIGDMGYGFVYSQDCCFDRDNDILYIAGYFNDGSPAGLLICDTTSGQCMLVGNFEGGMEITGFAIPWSPNQYDHDIAIRSIIKPASGNAGPITPVVKVKNAGLNTEYNVPVQLLIGKELISGTVEDFEATNAGYTHAPKLPQPDAWAWGAPTSGPMAAHSGFNVWATNLAGPYPPSMWCYLLTAPFTVPGGAMFNFWHW